MDQKTIGIVSYITLVGWIIALITYNGNPEKGSLARFHLRQSIGIMLTGAVLYIGTAILLVIIPFLFFIMPLIGIAMLILWILGLVSAVNGEEKPVPLVGEFIQKTFTFIK